MDPNYHATSKIQSQTDFTSSGTSESMLLEQFEIMTNSGMWEMDMESKRLTWSKGLPRIFGYEPEDFDVDYDTLLAMVYWQDRGIVHQHFTDFLKGEIPFKIKHRIVQKDGRNIWVVSKASFSSDPLTKRNKVIGVIQDIHDFKQTKEKLKSEKEKNRSLIENLDGIFWEADAQTFEFSYVSPQAELITGYTPEEWLGQKDFWQSQIHPLDREIAIRTCHLETQNLKDHSFVYRFITKDGRIIWLNDRVNVVSKNGVAVKLRGMMVDITSEKETAHALQEEIRLNQSLIQQLPSVFFLFDTNGKFLLWNHRLEEVSGYSAKEISEMSPEQFFAPKDRSIFNDYAYQVTQKYQTDFELRLVAKCGKRIPFLFSASPLMYHGQDCIFGTGQDISELVESRKSTAKHIERFQFATRATSDAIWDFDVEKQTLYWGDGFQTLFGYDPHTTEISYQILLNLIHPEDRERILKLIHTYTDPKSTQSHCLEEYRFLKKDGTYAFVLDKAVMIRNESGMVTRVVGAMQDISRRKEFEQSLKMLNVELARNVNDLAISNQELQQFAFVASHDLQEPLRMISSFMGLLERKYKHVLDNKALEYISFATNGARQMQRIILDLLELSRVGKVGENKVNIDVKELIDELKHYLKKAIKEKDAQIICEDLPVVHSFKTPLFQIFQNLIGNSIKYSKLGVTPQILLRGRECAQFWEFSVEDNGIGIDQEYFAKIFVLFQRLHRQGEYDGTGMGLAIVKKAVKFLDGEIRLDSRPGVGSKFTFTVKK